MKKMYFIPETRVVQTTLRFHIADATSPQIDEQEAEIVPGDDGDALGKERDMWGNDVGGGIW